MPVCQFPLNSRCGGCVLSRSVFFAWLMLLTSCNSAQDALTRDDSSSGALASTVEPYPEDVEGDDRPGLIVTGLEPDEGVPSTSPWLVSSSTFRKASITPGTGDGFLMLFQYPDDFPIAAHLDFYEMRLDTCKVYPPDEAQAAEQQPRDSLPPPAISGGNNVVINTQSGPWFQYDIVNTDDGVVYETDNELPGVLPESATLSVPGKLFPTISAHPLFEPPRPVRLLPQSSRKLTSNSAYSWIPADGSGYMQIDFLGYSDQQRFAGFLATCWVEDDGSFIMPDEVKSLVSESEYEFKVRYSRVYQRLDVANGIVIRQQNQVSE